jgi:Mn-dependent DtxR family transcriptional regulator
MCKRRYTDLVLHESAEDYLETILILYERNGQVRSIDIVNEMNFSKPSISIAMKKLRENGYINMDVNGLITLTGEGRAIAERIYSRHKLLTKVLVAIGIDEEKAASEACKIEHDIDDETYEKIGLFYMKYKDQIK